MRFPPCHINNNTKCKLSYEMSPNLYWSMIVIYSCNASPILTTRYHTHLSSHRFPVERREFSGSKELILLVVVFLEESMYYYKAGRPGSSEVTS